MSVSDATVTVLLVGALSVLPILLVVLSSFAKMAIVLTILRNAIGAPGVPPRLVITGFALLLTAFVMAPVASAVVSEVRPVLQDPGEPSVVRGESEHGELARYLEAARRAWQPYRQFLARHARPADVRAFTELADSLGGPPASEKPVAGDPVGGDAESARAVDPTALALALAFVVSELRSAFVIGIAVLLPFVIIDLVVASALVAMGLSSLPNASLSVPLKLLLFVSIDGWQLLSRGLLAGYA